MNRREFMKGTFITGGLVGLTGCATLTDPEKWYSLTADNPIAVEAADTIGYGLGLFAAKDAIFREKVESYYGMIKDGDVTPAVVNAALQALDIAGPEYAFFGHKIVRWLKMLGAEFDTGGALVDIGIIDPELLETGKGGYLAALAASGVA